MIQAVLCNEIEIKTTQIKKNLPLPDVRVIWGRTLRAIKQANKIMLHTVCVSLGYLDLVGDTLRISVPSKLDYEILKKPQNSGDLVDTLHKLGYNLNIEFVLDVDAVGDDDKIAKLKRILGADINII